MDAFSKVVSQVIPLDMDHVDTDMIIPAQFLTKTQKCGYGDYLFHGLRKQNPNFVLNDPMHENSQILMSKSNFGCGSSREHAVWAIVQSDIKVVIAKSYSDIFYNNAAKNGLLLICLESSVIDTLLTQAKETAFSMSVDLNSQTISIENNESYCFDYDSFRKECFLKGQDDLDYLLEATA